MARPVPGTRRAHVTPLRRRETPAERSDRNWNELLQELRVTQTGLQILTGFLLTLPFQARFTELTPGLVVIYLAAVVSGVLATMLVVAPVPVHRALFRRQAKRRLVDAADNLARAGLVFLAITVTLVTALVFSLVAGPDSGQTAAVVTAVAFLVAWFGLPLWMRSRRPPPKQTSDRDRSRRSKHALPTRPRTVREGPGTV